MATMATTHTETYQITRITRHIPKPFSHVLAKLQSSIKKDPHSKPLNLTTQPSIAAFEADTHALLGPHGFMQFHLLDHGTWLALHNPTDVPHAGKKALRVIYGNPLIAITMLRHDVRAGLHVPVDALVVERGEGMGTDVVYVRPSSVIAGWEGAGEELRGAAEKLDGKVEGLWEWVGGDDEDGVKL